MRVREAPPPLPPESRTVGQLVAEAIRLYGRRFWPSLALGIAPAILTVAFGGLDRETWLPLMATVGGVVLSASYVAASAIAGDVPFVARRWLAAVAAGAVVFVPFPFLVLIFVLPAVAWLALVGLVVPVLILERRGVRESFTRALALARADYVHALGSLATLALIVFLTQSVLFFLLVGQGEQTRDVAMFLATLVVSPILFLGAALLYFDQAARVVGSRRKRGRRRDADVHPAVDAHRSGSADP